MKNPSARDLVESVREIFQRGSNGKVVVFGDENYAEIRLIENGVVVLQTGCAVRHSNEEHACLSRYS